MKRYLVEVDEVTWSFYDGDEHVTRKSERNGEGLWSDWFDSHYDALTALLTRGGLDKPELHGPGRYDECGSLTFQMCEIWECEVMEDGSIDDYRSEQIEGFYSLTDKHRKAWEEAKKYRVSVKDAYEALVKSEKEGE